MSNRPLVPENYMETVKAGGPIESKYLAMGSYKAAVTLSHTQKPIAQSFLWEYDETKV